MSKKLIYGIQQIGVGVEDAEQAFEWYGKNLGSDVLIFDDNSRATHMARYMGGKPRDKRALLALNMQGGSGFELWQYVGRTPKRVQPELQVGDLGINISKIKSRDIQKSYDRLTAAGVNVLGDIQKGPDGSRSFHIIDPYNNILRVKEFSSWYANNGQDLGGTFGCIIGVSDVETSLKLYKDILGYDTIVYDKTGTFDDMQALPAGDQQYRRVLLAHTAERSGGFSKLFGESQIELVQAIDRSPKKLFEGRYWGDIGFIHLCFDINNMRALVQECSDNGFPFTVLSEESFDMGDANGHFGYIEDPDGTLIEFVETHKVPLIKSINWNINLRNRDPKKPLPNWLIKAMAMKRVRFK